VFIQEVSFRVFLSSTVYSACNKELIMSKSETHTPPKRPVRISPELAEVLKMLSALETRDMPVAPAKKV
jgi:hypothetical protein